MLLKVRLTVKLNGSMRVALAFFEVARFLLVAGSMQPLHSC